MLSKFKLNQLYFKDTQFANLMTRRIFNVLLIANPYDAFMLEDDGRIDEKIFNEYTSLSLRYPPRFTQVSTCEEALTSSSACRARETTTASTWHDTSKTCMNRFRW